MLIIQTLTPPWLSSSLRYPHIFWPILLACWYPNPACGFFFNPVPLYGFFLSLPYCSSLHLALAYVLQTFYVLLCYGFDDVFVIVGWYDCFCGPFWFTTPKILPLYDNHPKKLLIVTTCLFLSHIIYSTYARIPAQNLGSICLNLQFMEKIKILHLAPTNHPHYRVEHLDYALLHPPYLVSSLHDFCIAYTLCLHSLHTLPPYIEKPTHLVCFVPPNLYLLFHPLHSLPIPPNPLSPLDPILPLCYLLVASAR